MKRGPVCISNILFLISLFISSPLSCSSKAESFTQYPDFEKFFIDYPPKETIPNEIEKNLLQQFQPRFYIKEGQAGFIDFYEDYIAHGILRDDKGIILSDQVDQSLLNQYKQDRDVVFSYVETDDKTSRSVVYGRVDYDSLQFQGKQVSLIFLTFQLVFPYSGLPEGIPGWQRWFSGFFASIEDWHQLDHYIAATIVLDINRTPIAVTLQQHNYQTTYIINQDIILPEDQRIELDIAYRSNELYPHYKGRKEHRNVSFLSEDTVEYLVFGENKPLLGAFDITYGEIEVPYNLKFLPQTDAFYRFQGKLGENRFLPGRDGPPGADYNTIPALKPKGVTMVVSYRKENDFEFVQLLGLWKLRPEDQIPKDIKQRYIDRFFTNLNSTVK